MPQRSSTATPPPHMMPVRYNVSPEELSRPREPFFNRFPAVVLALTAAICSATAFQFMAGDALENFMFEVGALIGGPDYRGYPRPWGDFAPLVLHVFLHGGIFHLGMNMTAMVAFGPPIAMAFGRGIWGAAGFLVFFTGCAIAGALAQIGWFEFANESGVAIGASTALSGFLPAVGYLQGGRRMAIRMSVPWLVINLVLAALDLAGGASVFGMRLAWMAHLGGLAGGFVLFPLMIGLFNPRARP